MFNPPPRHVKTPDLLDGGTFYLLDIVRLSMATDLLVRPYRILVNKTCITCIVDNCYRRLACNQLSQSIRFIQTYKCSMDFD